MTQILRFNHRAELLGALSSLTSPFEVYQPNHPARSSPAQQQKACSSRRHVSLTTLPPTMLRNHRLGPGTSTVPLSFLLEAARACVFLIEATAPGLL